MQTGPNTAAGSGWCLRRWASARGRGKAIVPARGIAHSIARIVCVACNFACIVTVTCVIARIAGGIQHASLRESAGKLREHGDLFLGESQLQEPGLNLIGNLLAGLLQDLHGLHEGLTVRQVSKLARVEALPFLVRPVARPAHAALCTQYCEVQVAGGDQLIRVCGLLLRGGGNRAVQLTLYVW